MRPSAAWHSRGAGQARRTASPLLQSPSTSWVSWLEARDPKWWQCLSSLTAGPWWSYCPAPSRCPQSASSYVLPWSLSLKIWGEKRFSVTLKKKSTAINRDVFQHNLAPLTSDVNGLQGKSLLLIVYKSGLFCLVSHCWQRFSWARVGAVWTGYKKEKKTSINTNIWHTPQTAYHWKNKLDFRSA